jgi:host factor-I protein
MTPDRASNIQDEFFNRARRDAHPVTIFLTNGKKLQGRIRAFDKFTVVVEINRQEQMIFKHAISTVALGRPHPDRGPGDGDASSSEPAESGE